VFRIRDGEACVEPHLLLLRIAEITPSGVPVKMMLPGLSVKPGPTKRGGAGGTGA
jgi:hypothetical protein